MPRQRRRRELRVHTCTNRSRSSRRPSKTAELDGREDGREGGRDGREGGYAHQPQCARIGGGGHGVVRTAEIVEEDVSNLARPHA